MDKQHNLPETESEPVGQDNLKTTPKPHSAGELIIADIKRLVGAKVELAFYINDCKYLELAQSTIPLSQAVIGRQAVVSFINGDTSSPIMLGVLHSPLYEMLDNFEITPFDPVSVSESTSDARPVEPSIPKNAEVNEAVEPVEQKTSSENMKDLPVMVDGNTVVINANQQLQLQCGASSITLTKEGKILIRGKYLLNRASGVNRIVGGSVQVN